jgi:hypothetical protein
VSSYFREKFQFSESEILDYIRNAARFENVELKEADYLKDLLESICILQRDGLFVSFTHRSFQEYFAAVFISRSPSISIGELLDNFCERPADNVIQMAFDMNRPLIEREWVLGKISLVEERIASLDNNIIEIAELFMGRIEIVVKIEDEQAIWTATIPSDGWLPCISVFWRLYRDHFNEHAVWEMVKEDYHLVREEFERRGMLTRPGGVRQSSLMLKAADHGWVMKTSLGRALQHQCVALLALKGVVTASVTHQKRLVGTLFQ